MTVIAFALLSFLDKDSIYFTAAQFYLDFPENIVKNQCIVKRPWIWNQAAEIARAEIG